jgi:hypothetical protein
MAMLAATPARRGTITMAEKRLARCPRCGSAAREEDERCPRCDALLAAIAPAPPFADDASGVPVQRFASSLAGPPTAPEPFVHPDRLPLFTGAGLPIEASEATHPIARRKNRAGLLSLLALIALVGAGLAVGVVAQRAGGLTRGALPFLLPPATATFTEAVPTPTSPVICAIASADAAAARALTNAQLTTGVRDAAKQDYRPIDATSRFTVGQLAYLTFKIATPQAGTAGVSYCAPSGRVPGTLAVPAGSQQRYAQFSTRFAPQDVGGGVVTLTWNDAVAASLAFTVVPPATVPAA